MVTIRNVTAGCFRYDYLKRRYPDICFFRAGNKFIALTGYSKVPDMVLIEESTKVPEWKQALELQMGKVPSSTRTTLRRYRPMVILRPENYSYEIYR